MEYQLKTLSRLSHLSSDGSSAFSLGGYESELISFQPQVRQWYLRWFEHYASCFLPV